MGRNNINSKLTDKGKLLTHLFKKFIRISSQHQQGYLPWNVIYTDFLNDEFLCGTQKYSYFTTSYSKIHILLNTSTFLLGMSLIVEFHGYRICISSAFIDSAKIFPSRTHCIVYFIFNWSIQCYASFYCTTTGISYEHMTHTCSPPTSFPRSPPIPPL